MDNFTKHNIWNLFSLSFFLNFVFITLIEDIFDFRRAYTCPICGAYGDIAHTVKYCPKGPYNSNTISTANAFKYMRNSTGKRRSK